MGGLISGIAMHLSERQGLLFSCKIIYRSLVHTHLFLFSSFFFLISMEEFPEIYILLSVLLGFFRNF